MAKRTFTENLSNFIGICMAIIAMGLDIAILAEEGTDNILIKFIEMSLAMISILINIVDFATGDCEFLRDKLMIILCLFWCKLIPCASCQQFYEQTSVKLLMLFNALLWCVLFYFDLLDVSETGSDALSQMEEGKFVFEEEQLKLIKLIIVLVGMGTSFTSFLFKIILEVIICCCKICCFCVCCLLCLGIAGYIVALISYASASSGDYDSGY